MKNRWDITKAQSEYEFDRWGESDERYFRTIANVADLWDDELKLARELEYDFHWPSPVRQNGTTLDGEPDQFQYDYERRLCQDWGVDPEYVVYRQHVVDERTPKLNELGERIGLTGGQINVQTQYTGMMLHLHIDTLTGLRKNRIDHTSDYSDSDQWGRVFVMLEDWQYGHIISFGNTFVKPWKRGDVIWFDWKNIPHSTANTGPWPRSLAKVTGKITPRFESLING